MKISISNLSEGLHAFHFSADSIQLDLGDNFTREISVDVTLEKTSKEVFLKADLSTMGRFVCDRCVDEFDRNVVAAYSMVYTYDERTSNLYGEDEVHVLKEGTTFIDITDDVRQFILLGVPLKLLCKEQCSGLCPHCGKNWNHGTCSCETEDLEPRSEVLRRKLKS